MAQVRCVCISTQRKSRGENIRQCQASRKGLAGDIHWEQGIRQVSMLPFRPVQQYFAQRGESIQYGRFGENLVVDGLDWETLKDGDILRAGTVILQIVRIGAGGPKSDAYKGEKVCAPMEHLFVFCKILEEGILQEEMDITKED